MNVIDQTSDVKVNSYSPSCRIIESLSNTGICKPVDFNQMNDLEEVHFQMKSTGCECKVTIGEASSSVEQNIGLLRSQTYTGTI